MTLPDKDITKIKYRSISKSAPPSSALCMAVVITIVIIKQLKEYYAIRHTYLLDTFTEAPPPQFEEWLLRTKEELQVKGNITMVITTAIQRANV